MITATAIEHRCEVAGWAGLAILAVTSTEEAIREAERV
jgi:hypothetical protein